AYAEQAGYTEEYYQETEKENAILSKVREYAIKDVAVTEDELKAEYDSRVASAKESYESNLSAYGTSVMNGETVYYAPAGYRYVRQILVGFTEEDSAAISAANNERTSAQTVLTTAQNALTENQDALAAEEATEEEKEALTAAQPELQTAVDEAQAVLDEKAAAAEAALNTAFENIQAKLDEVKEKLAAGEDFEALIEQYNDDPGMATNPNGYAVCEGYSSFDPAFVTAAMALEKVGDVSEPVRSDSYGWYIIRYNAEIPEGEVGLDAVRDLIESELLDEKQDAVYDETVQNWISAADVKSWLDRLAD
ncbi:MAG: peptidylprolyl isomerase, partial [Clostridia bacterium]|nr:peptidylprolyl isomerase [Clostridia bacterium]